MRQSGLKMEKMMFILITAIKSPATEFIFESTTWVDSNPSVQVRKRRFYWELMLFKVISWNKNSLYILVLFLSFFDFTKIKKNKIKTIKINCFHVCMSAGMFSLLTVVLLVHVCCFYLINENKIGKQCRLEPVWTEYKLFMKLIMDNYITLEQKNNRNNSGLLMVTIHPCMHSIIDAFNNPYIHLYILP